MIFVVLSSPFVWSYRPSYDVLFKNNGNPIYTGETTAADVLIKDLSSNNTFKVKIQFSKFQKKNYFLQAIFDQNFNQQEVIKVSRISGVDSLNVGTSTNPLVHMFYGLLEMYMANNNDILMSGFKQLGINFSNSKDTINKDQHKLLQDYLYFSRKKARGKTSERENPLKSSDPAKQAIINNILKQAYYLNPQKATLVRINNRFLWSIDEKNIKALFDQVTRKLVSIELPEYNKLLITPNDLQIFGNYYSVPKKLIIEELGTPKFEISIQSVSNFRESLDSFQNRAANLQKTAAAQLAEKKNLISQFPDFILH